MLSVKAPANTAKITAERREAREQPRRPTQTPYNIMILHYYFIG